MADDIREFSEATKGGEFLFKGEVSDYYSKLHSIAFRAGIARISANRPNRPIRDSLIDEEEVLMDFLKNQAPHVEKHFRSYLDLSKL